MWGCDTEVYSKQLGPNLRIKLSIEGQLAGSLYDQNLDSISMAVSFFYIFGPLYRQRSGFAKQYFVLELQTTSGRVYTCLKRFGDAQAFLEAVKTDN